MGVVPSGMEKVVSELPDLICEPDLYISQLALKLSKGALPFSSFTLA